MEGLSVDNILEAEEIDNLFLDEEIQETPPEETENKEETKEDTTEVVDVNELFDGEPESVGSEEDNTEKKEDTDSTEKGTSPNKNFYSSIAKALQEEGIFPNSNEEEISKIQNPEDFKELIENQIKAGLEEKQRRIDEALNVGMETTEIKRYESTLDYLDSIKDEHINDESEEGEKLRKNLIFQDFINRGYSKERATREVTKSFNAGTDIEDAKEALKSNVDYFNLKYEDIINENKKQLELEELKRKEQAEKLRTSILNDSTVFGDINVDKSTRQKVYDNISKPIYKDPDTGEYYTALLKYQKENQTDFLKNLGLIFTLTNGFKNLDGLVKTKVRKEVKKGLRELENTLNNTSRTLDGNLKFVSNVEEDSESFIGKNWKLDV